MKTRTEAIKEIVATHPGAAFVFGNGLQSREAAVVADQPNNFYMLHGMGEAYSVGIGLKHARPDLEVVIIEGDGGAVMGLAGFAMYPAVSGMAYYVLSNGVYETTGGQTLPATSYGPEWIRVINIARGKIESPNPPTPRRIRKRFQEWLT